MARLTPQEKVIKALEKHLEQIQARIEQDKIREEITKKELQHARERMQVKQ